MRFVIFLLLTGASLFAEKKPNIIVFYADDLGTGMLSCYTQKLIKTPHIDKFATQGIRFNNFYGNNVCAPARANLLTGRHDGHSFRANKGGLSIKLHRGVVSQEEYDKILERTYNERKDFPFIGKMAQDSGYHTSYFGKLGMGYSENHAIMKLYGFDHYVGLYDSRVCWSFYPEFYWDNGEKIMLPHNPKFKNNYPNCPLVGEEQMTYTEDIWLREALEYLEEKKDTPFFMVYSTQLPHGPASIAPKDHMYKDRTEWTEKERVFASMIDKMDKSLGAIVDKLGDLNIENNTIVIFTGDNGHESNYYIAPREKSHKAGHYWDGHKQGLDIFKGGDGRRGIKRHNFEGGLRVPTIVKWSGKVASGSQTDHVATTYDIFATVQDITGNDQDYRIDGLSFKNTLLGESQKEHDYIFFKNSTGASRDAVISGDWKLIQELDTNLSNFPEKKRVYTWNLYNLKDDPLEKTNLIDQHPEKLEELMALVKEANQEIQ